jgi:catechol 2,3-dioxygenase-like lactoylglutathione lyase family enzyme
VFERITLRASDREASVRFYETVLATLGIDVWPDFAIEQADGDVTRGLHIGFSAPSRAAVDEFWRAGTAAGYRDDGAPGPRPQYVEDYYGGFLLDPDGNSAEAVHHGGVRMDGIVDHLWIRVADLAASKAFYEELAPRAGFRLKRDTPERAAFAAPNGTFSVLPGEPTRHLRMAFATTGEPAELTDPDGNLVELVAAA